MARDVSEAVRNRAVAVPCSRSSCPRLLHKGCRRSHPAVPRVTDNGLNLGDNANSTTPWWDWRATAHSCVELTDLYGRRSYFLSRHSQAAAFCIRTSCAFCSAGLATFCSKVAIRVSALLYSSSGNAHSHAQTTSITNMAPNATLIWISMSGFEDAC